MSGVPPNQAQSGAPRASESLGGRIIPHPHFRCPDRLSERVVRFSVGNYPDEVMRLFMGRSMGGGELVGCRGDVGKVTDRGGVKYASFSDLDGNVWLQELTPELRQPNQSGFVDPGELRE